MSINNKAKGARRDSLSLLKKAMGRSRRVYLNAADKVANEVRKLKTIADGTDKYRLTIASKEKLQKDLLAQSKILNQQIKVIAEKGVGASINANAGRYTSYTEGYLLNYTDLDKQVVKDVMTKINSDLVEVQLLKQYSDGLTYSRRIWKASKAFERDLQGVIAEGIARNRDMIDIATDIRVYVKDGREQWVKRIGSIDKNPRRPGESEEDYLERVRTFKARVSKRIEYNSLRIVRTQMQGATQDCNISAADYTPSVQSFDWTLSPAHMVYSICEDIVDGNPYTYESFTFGTPPHPNCLSYVIYNEKSNREFVRDLKAWTKNPTAPGADYMNTWKSTYYDPMVAGDRTNYFKLILDRNNKEQVTKSLKRVA